ncbi:hypothetical protein [Chamaesiphon minutus]|uniref:hypothetical protein n=1 Tax=Chamaesiphon minutus TaxID=1173032 RepID=UPI000317A2B9|nr:hypothetical protein [Chamaesiphon minutus]
MRLFLANLALLSQIYSTNRSTILNCHDRSVLFLTIDYKMTKCNSDRRVKIPRLKPHLQRIDGKFVL